MKEMINFTLQSIFFHTFKGFSTCHKILQRGADGFTSLPKEGMLQNFIILKNPLLSARIEPTNIGSNGKHTRHYTTEGDLLKLTNMNVQKTHCVNQMYCFSS
jgi:hypothetical protein